MDDAPFGAVLWQEAHACLRHPAITWLRGAAPRDVLDRGELRHVLDGVGYNDAGPHDPIQAVGWIGWNEPLAIVTLFACAESRVPMVPLNWRLAEEELRYQQEHSGFGILEFTRKLDQARQSFVPEHDLPLVRDWVPPPASLRERPHGNCRYADAPLIIGYTSGTTGRPKGAVLTQAAVAANAANAIALFGMTPQDRVLTVLPLFHLGGLCIQTVPALIAGAHVLLMDRFDADAFFDVLARDRPTLTLLVPTLMQALVSHPRWAAADLSSLRSIGAGSSEVPLHLIEAFHAKGVPVQQVYGMTETGPIAIAQSRAEALAAPGSIGHAAPLCEARILRADGTVADPGEAGEIVVRGPNVMGGYWRDPAATAAALRDGWFHTGDVGHRDAEGRFWFTDRLTRVIISGGENIYPAELERVLAEAPGVAEAAVIGRPDARWGEVPVAVVVPGAGFDRAAVLRHLEGRLARFKHPRDLVAVEALPRTALGKVQAGALRALLDGPRA